MVDPRLLSFLSAWSDAQISYDALTTEEELLPLPAEKRWKKPVESVINEKVRSILCPPGGMT